MDFYFLLNEHIPSFVIVNISVAAHPTFLTKKQPPSLRWNQILQPIRQLPLCPDSIKMKGDTGKQNT